MTSDTPKAEPGKYRALACVILLTVLALDQLSKAWVIQIFADTRRPIEITSFFDLVMVWNQGISFGMFAGQKQPLLLSLMSAVIIAVLLTWLRRNQSRLVACALGCIIGGAVGNVIDRIRFGAVADFLDFHLGPYHWPAFNIADSSIFIGVVLLCVSSMVMPTSKPDGRNEA